MNYNRAHKITTGQRKKDSRYYIVLYTRSYKIRHNKHTYTTQTHHGKAMIVFDLWAQKSWPSSQQVPNIKRLPIIYPTLHRPHDSNDSIPHSAPAR